MLLKWKLMRFAVLLCSVFCITGCGNSEPLPQLPENIPAGEVVQICVGDVIGNGVLWEKTEENLIVVTAGHVLEMGTGEAQVTFSDGLTVAVTSYEIGKPDLAFIVIDADKISAKQLAQYQPVGVVSENVEAKDAEARESETLQSEADVVLKAFGTGQESQLLEGTVLNPWIYIEDFESHMILAEMDVEPGMSGSGLFDCEGHFLGILCGESEEGEIAVLPQVIMQAEYVIFSENF